MLKDLTSPSEQIVHELERCGIPIVYPSMANDSFGQLDFSRPSGLLGDSLDFTRQPTYWEVSGKQLSLVALEELGVDEVCKTDIVVVYDSRREWLHDYEVPDGSLLLGDFVRRMKSEYKSPSHIAEEEAAPSTDGFVPHVLEYRILSEIGLRVFVDVVQSHVLAKEPIAA